MLSLSGCAGSGISIQASNLPPIPNDIERCIRKVVPRPESVRTKKQAMRLIYRLKRSEFAKTRCGKRLIKLYNENRTVINQL